MEAEAVASLRGLSEGSGKESGLGQEASEEVPLAGSRTLGIISDSLSKISPPSLALTVRKGAVMAYGEDTVTAVLRCGSLLWVALASGHLEVRSQKKGSVVGQAHGHHSAISHLATAAHAVWSASASLLLAHYALEPFDLLSSIEVGGHLTALRANPSALLTSASLPTGQSLLSLWDARTYVQADKSPHTVEEAVSAIAAFHHRAWIGRLLC